MSFCFRFFKGKSRQNLFLKGLASLVLSTSGYYFYSSSIANQEKLQSNTLNKAMRDVSQMYIFGGTSFNDVCRLIKENDENNYQKDERIKKAASELLVSLQRMNDQVLKLKTLANKLKNEKSRDQKTEVLYRCTWISLFLKSMCNQLHFYVTDTVPSFDQETEAYFSTTVSPAYLDQQHIYQLIDQLEKLIPKASGDNLTLFARYMKFKQNFMIAKDKYEAVFRACLDYTQSKTKSKIPFGLADMIQQQYYDDGKDSVEATCEPISEQPNTSLIRVNLARPISVEKCQQLTAHEGTHHIQNCLTRPAFTKYPELAFEFKYSPMDFVFEAAAELAVDLIYPREERLRQLKEQMLPMINKANLADQAELLLKIDDITTKLWRGSTLVAKQYLNGEISMKEGNRRMMLWALKPRASWPNIDFIHQYRSYVISYGWGKELLYNYLKAQPGDIWTNFIKFLEKPEPFFLESCQQAAHPAK